VENEEQKVGGDGTSHGELGESREDTNKRLLGRAQSVGDQRSSSLGDIGVAVGLGCRNDRSLGNKEGVEDLRKGKGCSNTDYRGQGKHQTDHDTSKVTGEDSVDDNKDLLILEVAEAHVDTGREQPDQQVQIEEEGGPGGRLMLRDGCNDGNVNLCVSSIPERVETSAPGSNDSREGEKNEDSGSCEEDDQDEGAEQRLELLARQSLADELDTTDKLQETEDT
jgi:hypothetical protein